jgi:pimeloyl-ACP methyl ester carboxylesterase
MRDHLHVEVCGDGEPTLVLLHAFASSGRMFAAMQERLARRNRCLTIDLRGFGRSPPAGAYTVAGHATDVLDVVARHAAERYVLVGHSMGGKVALAVAARRPAGLAGLALLAPSPPTPEPIGEEDRGERLSAHGDRAAARQTLDRIVAHPVPAIDADQFVADTLACSASAWAWWLRDGSREDISSLLKTIAVPMLVVSGDADPVVPLEALRGPLLEACPGASLTRIAGAGHLLPLERPQACAEAIAAFADGLSAGSGTAPATCRESA